ncbi:SusC/RagA family TonB-linked outer membrane protein [Sphingobacterium sp. Mn56C]|uniref:SusC/RagA family TonB-linked outer membrane protein n=1 Tax=Sphingobacterium sp. Mn56C TaxID=3395261 RepID=UPI003BE9EBE1
MKLTTFLLLLALMEVSAHSYGQQLTLKATAISMENILLEVRKQTRYDVVIFTSKFNASRKISVNFSQTPLQDVMTQITQGMPYTFDMENKSVVIKERTASINGSRTIATAENSIDIKGQVVNENGQPLMGASIKVKGTTKTTVAGAGGVFSLAGVPEKAILQVSYLGYLSQEIQIKGTEYVLLVKLQPLEKSMDDVVITGTGINRKKDSFTGATSTFSGEQLKQIGNRNVLQSLKTLDPSFIMVESNLQGSNPNRLPDIEVRGKTTINTANLNDQYSSNPNQPLFILDGFETNLQTIYDLDINRVASITLLKDAASTALYGAKAANGVVVVETIRPVAGELRISYASDFSFDIPDFSSYNLMNAEEKLTFERLSGVYSNTPIFQWQSDSVYNAKLANIRRGVNTYWLKEPVHTGVTQRHSVRFSGGTAELTFGAGANYRKQEGVMKGSDRNSWAGNFDLNYRKNRLNISNNLTLTNLWSNDSPYGAFSNFSRANPYYAKTNADGSIPMFLDPGQTNTPNPLYNASLFSLAKLNGFNFRENVNANYTLSNNFRVNGGLSYGRDNGENISFIPPDNTAFAGVDAYEKGRYTKTQTTSNFFSANLMLSYAKVIAKHQFNGNIRADLQQSSGNGSGFTAVGFPYGTNGNPRFAYGYLPSGRPSSSTNKSRSVGFLGSINYAYDQRFLLDATYRLDGTSVFGSNKQFKPFASIGLGWNIHKEQFLQHQQWLDLLKLRANVGYTGNQNIGQFTSSSVYTFQTGTNPFGQGLDMTSLGNPNLDWQKTLQKSFGLDIGILQNRISGYIEYFDKQTDPLIVPASDALPSSVGINSNYSINVGSLQTRGWSFNGRFSPIYNLKDRIIWTVGFSGQRTTSLYGGFGNKLEALNRLQLNSKSLIRYQDGNSPDDIFAVVSRGIDPATGNEIFQRVDGSYTFLYNTDDIVKVGNTRPKIEGVINSNFTYKNFTFGANVRYRIGGYVYNSALYSKVENIAANNLIFNQDRRALYERWKEPGDEAQFKAISLTSSTPMSSRFVQKDNHFVGESISASWRVSDGWIRQLKLRSLSMTVYVNDIFRLESVKSERGIDYPFARSASFSLNASF